MKNFYNILAIVLGLLLMVVVFLISTEPLCFNVPYQYCQ
jgi:hypothetical protein